jgi:rhodanese-related sulfurtransferase
LKIKFFNNASYSEKVTAVINALASIWTYRLIRWLWSFVFLYAGATKLADPKAFAALIDAYGIVPDQLLMPVAVGLPLLEVATAIGLIADVRGSLAVISGLMAVFIAILVYGIRMGLDVDCGCFGPEDIEFRAYHGLREALYRDLVMAAGIVYLYGWRRFRSADPMKLSQVLQRVMKGDLKMGTLAKTGIILCVFVIMGAGVVMAADKFEEEFGWEKISIGLYNQTKAGGYKLVGTEELKGWIDAKKDMLIVDTMPYEDSYKKEHVPGAKQFLFPIPDMKAWDTKETSGKSEQDFLQMLGPDKNRLIVIYCGFVKCTRSHNGATWAVKNGFTNVYRYPGGIFAWKGAKYPAAEVK